MRHLEVCEEDKEVGTTGYRRRANPFDVDFRLRKILKAILGEERRMEPIVPRIARSIWKHTTSRRMQ